MSRRTEIIAKNIKRLRQEKDWTLRDLSDRTSISFSQLSKYERGLSKRAETSSALQEIATALGVEVDILLYDQEAMIIEELRGQYAELLEDPKIMEILKKLVNANHVDRQRILRIVQASLEP